MPNVNKIGYDHDALPELKVGNLLLEAIEFGHGKCKDTSKPNAAPSSDCAF